MEPISKKYGTQMLYEIIWNIQQQDQLWKIYLHGITLTVLIIKSILVISSCVILIKTPIATIHSFLLLLLLQELFLLVQLLLHCFILAVKVAITRFVVVCFVQVIFGIRIVVGNWTNSTLLRFNIGLNKLVFAGSIAGYQGRIRGRWLVW